MPWAGPGLQLDHRRRVRGEPAALLVEQELEDLIGAEVRHEDETVRVVGADRVRVPRGGNRLQWRTDTSIGADRIDAHEMGAVGGAEQEASRPVEDDVRETFRERP